MYKCTSDAMCDMNMLCSKNGNCGMSCTMDSDCMSCGTKCLQNTVTGNWVCDEGGSAPMNDNTIRYISTMLCAKNAAGEYCGMLLDSPDIPTCQQLTDSGCCAGLVSQFILECGAPADVQAEVNMLKANCTGIDFDTTCGYPAPGACCQDGNCPGAAMSLLPHVGISLLIVMLKFFY